MRLLQTLVGTGAALALCAGSANAQTLFGSSCAGGSGVTPTLGISGTVATGQQWFLDVTAPGGIGLGYLLIGFSNTNASVLGGLPLPFDLGILFADPLWSGCPLNVDANYQISTYFFSPVVNGGLAQIQFPGFNSGFVFMQVLNIDPDFITRIAGVSQGIQIFPTPPSGPQPGDLVITEIMKDPAAVGDNLGEWFEILNTTNAAIDIEGWTLRDDGTDTMVLANGGSGIVVPANSYFVIGNNANTGTNGGVAVDFQWNGTMFLGNSDDEIVLVEPSGPTEIARVNYDNGITFPDSAGISMELDVAFLNEVDNDSGANWANSTCFLPNPSTDKGTPGIANDQCNVTPPGPGTGELIFTEIMKNPAVVGDNYGEWFEVYNTTGASIDMNGWTVKSGPNQFNVAGSFVIPAGGYGVFLRNGNPAENGGLDPMVINAYDYASAIFLGNTGQTLEIFNGVNKISSIVYDSVVFPDTNGRSMTLDPTVTQNLTNSLDGNNWCFSTSSYTGDGLDDAALPVTNVTQFGTPAGANDTCPIIPSGVPTGELVVTEIMNDGLDETNDQVWFELYNTSGIAIDINGYILTDSDGGYHVVNNGGPLNVAAGTFVTLGASGNLLTNGGVTHDYVYDGVFLDTFADSIVVATGAGAIVAQVDYNGGTGYPVANPGHSLIMDPTVGITQANSVIGSNWCKSYFTTYGTSANYGTPGGVNDACPIVPSGSPTGALIITEVLQDGASAGEGEEFFEIRNTTGSAIDIDGYILADQDNDYHIIDNGGALLVPANGRITLGTSNTLLTNGGVTHTYVYGKDMFLSNTIDEIVLANAAGAIVCQIAYDNGATYPVTSTGSSMILDPTAPQTQAASADGTNWCVSSTAYGDLTNNGTPAAANDSCGGGAVAPGVGDLIITEIMYNPAFVGDTSGEYFEMYNTTVNSIELSGLVFTDAGTNNFTIATSLVVAPGAYVVIGVNTTFATNGGVNVNYDWGSSNYALANGGDSIICKDGGGTTICSVAYTTSAPWPTSASTNGASLNLDSNSFTLAQSQVGSNWCASTTLIAGSTDRGTPGAANEDCP
jgi:hypothetical protein